MKHYTDQFEIHAEVAWQANAIDVRFGFRQRETGTFYVAQPLTYVALAESNLSPPALRLTKTDAQMLMDDLWRCGVRPTEGAGSAGSYAAQARHLEDMRAIAFASLGTGYDKP